MMALTTRLRPEARKAWLSKEPSRISPRSWKNTARVSLLPASPLFSPARQRSRSSGLEYHSIEQAPLDSADLAQRARHHVRFFWQSGEFDQLRCDQRVPAPGVEVVGQPARRNCALA